MYVFQFIEVCTSIHSIYSLYINPQYLYQFTVPTRRQLCVVSCTVRGRTQSSYLRQPAPNLDWTLEPSQAATFYGFSSFSPRRRRLR